jgi:hypothetical protein
MIAMFVGPAACLGQPLGETRIAGKAGAIGRPIGHTFGGAMHDT